MLDSHWLNFLFTPSYYSKHTFFLDTNTPQTSSDTHLVLIKLRPETVPEQE